MNIIEAIANRRSIRRFLNKDIDKETLLKILNAGISAPSPKNRQPWKFVVVSGSSKDEFLNIMKNGLENINDDYKIVGELLLPSTESTLKSIEEAPVIIFVINTENKREEKQTPLKKFTETTNIQSAAAAIENMMLASLEYGLGGLWITDIYYAIDKISEWLNTDKQIIAAVALGYPAETPVPLSKKKENELVEWK